MVRDTGFEPVTSCV